MRRVLTIATVLGLIGVVETFIVLVIAKDWFQLTSAQIQSFIYLKLAVAGHLNIVRRPHAASFPDQAVSRADFARGDSRHTSHRGNDCRVRLAGRADRLEIRRLCLDLLSGLGVYRGLGEAARLLSSGTGRETASQILGTNQTTVAQSCRVSWNMPNSLWKICQTTIQPWII